VSSRFPSSRSQYTHVHRYGGVSTPIKVLFESVDVLKCRQDVDEPQFQIDDDDEMGNDDADQDGDGMDYDEMVETDSENTSQDSESSAAEEMDMEENNPPETWRDHGDGDLHDHEGDDDEDEDEEDEDDEDEEQELGVTDDQGSDWNVRPIFRPPYIVVSNYYYHLTGSRRTRRIRRRGRP
jgi:hypothetical protein